jgi:hypothetical protein
MNFKTKYAASQIELESDDYYKEELKNHLENMEGIKYDDSKPDYSLIPPRALNDLVKVLTFGAKKYDRHNWKKVENAEQRYFAAAQRHLWAVVRGETHDPESGEHHYAHALCCIMYLLEFYSLQEPKNNIKC